MIPRLLIGQRVLARHKSENIITKKINEVLYSELKLARLGLLYARRDATKASKHQLSYWGSFKKAAKKYFGFMEHGKKGYSGENSRLGRVQYVYLLLLNCFFYFYLWTFLLCTFFWTFILKFFWNFWELLFWTFLWTFFGTFVNFFFNFFGLFLGLLFWIFMNFFFQFLWTFFLNFFELFF